MTITGTNHFTSFNAAVRYYSDYEIDMSLSELGQLVAQKLMNGEIHLGAPDAGVNEKIVQIDEGHRYAIVSEEA